MKKRRILILFSVWLVGVFFILRPQSVSGEIHYRLAWLDEGVTYNDTGWTVTTRSGYTVRIEQGYLTSYSAELVYCQHSHNFLSLFSSIFPLITARAGHSGDTSPAKVSLSLVESLTQPESFEWDSVTVAEPSYCQGHYLVGRADKTTQDMPADVDMNRVAVYISGTYLSPNAESTTPFVIRTDLGNGTLQDLHKLGASTNVHVEIGTQPVEITIYRDLATLFDRIDFAHMGADEQARALLDQLMAQTKIMVTGGNAH
jgi:hypothetical protein